MPATDKEHLSGDERVTGEHAQLVDESLVVEQRPQSSQQPAASELDNESAVETGETASRFVHWRRQRPFIPGLLVIISGVIMIIPAYLTFQISDLLVMISTISGVSTLLIGAVLIMFGIGSWLQPATSPYLGVLSILVAIIALPTSNIGGFVIGSLVGIIGGALLLGWEQNPQPKAQSTRPTSTATALALVFTGVGAAVAVSVVDPGQAQAREPLLFRPLPGLEKLFPSPKPLPTPEPLLPVPEAPSPPLLPPESQEHDPTPESPPTEHEDYAPEESAPAPAPDLGAVGTGISTVTADSVRLTGNVHATLQTVTVGGKSQRALVLTGDRLVAGNLGLQMPGVQGRGTLTTGQFDTRVWDGPVKIVATALTATPALVDVPTLPVTVDLNGDLATILDLLGVPDPHPAPNIGVPDMLMDVISLKDVTMQLVTLEGKNFSAPAVSLRAHR